jgi:peroxiredoxin
MARVLVIEDDPDRPGALEDNLVQAGHHAFAASTGKAGLKIAREVQPDVVLLDLVLPDMPGTSVAKELRRDPATQRIPIIMVTATGAKAPDFTLPDAHGKPVTLSALLAKGPAVVTFYRGGWCPFCDLQLRAYQRVLGAIHDLDAELVAILPQTPDYALSDIEKKQLTFPVLTDKGNRVAREFKLVFALSDALKRLQTGFGSVLPKFNGDDSWELPMPGTFVLDRHGLVRFASVDPNWTVRVEPAAILDALRGARAS